MSNKTKPDLIIFVRGGVVDSIAAHLPGLTVGVCDWDNAECDENAERECKRLEKIAETMSRVELTWTL